MGYIAKGEYLAKLSHHRKLLEYAIYSLLVTDPDRCFLWAKWFGYAENIGSHFFISETRVLDILS